MSTVDHERLTNLYGSGAYLSHSPDWSEGEVGEKVRGACEFLAAAGYDRVRTILDVGCGTGGLLEGLVRRLPAVERGLGIDIAEDAIRLADRFRGKDLPIELRCGTIADVDGTFDLAVVSHVLEHVVDPAAFLEEVFSRATVAYINVPIEFNVLYAARAGVQKGQYVKYGHVHFFNEAFLDEFLVCNGYEIIERGYGTEFRAQKHAGLGRVVHFLREALGLFGRGRAARWLGGFSYQVLIRRAAR